MLSLHASPAPTPGSRTLLLVRGSEGEGYVKTGQSVNQPCLALFFCAIPLAYAARGGVPSSERAA